MHNFNEKRREKNKAGQEVDVIVLSKYEESKRKAIALIEKYEDVDDGDFWILKNESKGGQIYYSGLIISHTACLKINASLTDDSKFRPECVTVDKDGYDGSLVYTYCCPEQGIYEVGEASKANCKNSYPYAMAFKRCFDRVVLKASKIAFDGIYSESESDSFSYTESVSESKSEPNKSKPQADAPEEMNEPITKAQISTLDAKIDESGTDRSMFLAYYDVEDLSQMTKGQYGDALNILKKKEEKGKVIGVEK